MAATGASPTSRPPIHGPLPRAYWLPPRGRGNGLEAGAWAPIADVPAQDVEFLLDALRDADVPGYAAKVGSPGLRRQCRIWVASLRSPPPKDALREALSRIHHTLPRQ